VPVASFHGIYSHKKISSQILYITYLLFRSKDERLNIILYLQQKAQDRNYWLSYSNLPGIFSSIDIPSSLLLGNSDVRGEQSSVQFEACEDMANHYRPGKEIDKKRKENWTSTRMIHSYGIYLYRQIWSRSLTRIGNDCS